MSFSWFFLFFERAKRVIGGERSDAAKGEELVGERSEPHQGQVWLPKGEPLGSAERAQRGTGVPHRVAVAQSRAGITSYSGVLGVKQLARKS